MSPHLPPVPQAAFLSVKRCSRRFRSSLKILTQGVVTTPRSRGKEQRWVWGEDIPAPLSTWGLVADENQAHGDHTH
jgi:hypothetical protein